MKPLELCYEPKKSSGASILGRRSVLQGGLGAEPSTSKKGAKSPCSSGAFLGFRYLKPYLHVKKTTLNDQKIQLTQTEKNRQQTKKIKVTKLKKKDVTKKYEKKRKYNSQTNKNGKTNKSK